MHNTKCTNWDEVPLTLSIMQVAEILGVGRYAVNNLIKSNQLPCIQIGRHIRIYRETLKEYLSQL